MQRVIEGNTKVERERERAAQMGNKKTKRRGERGQRWREGERRRWKIKWHREGERGEGEK